MLRVVRLTKFALDLFSGTGSATEAFEEHENWEVFRVEKDPDLVDKYGAELQADILELKPGDLPDPDFIWASPPCTDFSIACCYRKWTSEKLPKAKSVAGSVKLVYHTLWLIQEVDPEYWFLENPQGMLRNVMPFQPEGTVTYCQYGTEYMKPTDLYGNHPASMMYRRCSPSDICHVHNPRGEGEFRDRTKRAVDMDQTQDSVKLEQRSTFQQQTSGSNPEVRARVPRELSDAILKAVENPGKKQRQVTLK